MFKQWLLMLGLGILFGLGLLISGMANPENVLGFLDVFGDWQPSLMFVMLAACSVAFIFFSLAKQRTISVLGLAIQMPSSQDITPQLIFGSLMFGVGWGLVGLCPGPALVLLGLFKLEALIFVLSMLVGMWLVDRVLFKLR